MEVDFEHRLPKSNEAVKIGMVDLADGDKWIELGESRAWCWQQGGMLQWRPASDREVVWNDRKDEWLVADTYPHGPQREQILYLQHAPTGGFVLLGRFPSTYGGEWRCDLHPRVSRDGRLIIVDSPHGGDGRQQHVIDISPILSPAPSTNKADREPRS